MQRRHFLLGGVGAVAAGAVGFSTLADGTEPPSTDDTATSAPTTATASVTRGDLATEREFRASVTYGDPWMLGIDRQGTVTSSHAAGVTVGPGETLVRIDERPVHLAIGTMPLYRTLEKVDTRQRDETNRRLTLLEGPDVTQLQEFLLDAGHDADGAMTVDGVLGSSTEKAIKAWQTAVGLSPNGRVDGAQLVFAPEPVRIAKQLRVGSSFGGLEVTNADAKVLVDTSNRDRGALAPGTAVTIVLADGTRVDGATAKQEQATGADGSAIWRTTITSDDTLPDEVSNATIEVVDVAATDAVLVPASALIALAEGGFAVERVEEGSARLVRVEVRHVLDGRAAVDGEIQPGDTVVVPS